MEIDKVEQYYARPRWHPTLSEFCTELTGIEQGTVDTAPEYPDALAMMRDNFGKNALKSNPWISWGDYDRVMFEHMKRNVWAFPPCGEKDPDYFKNMYPWGRQHINLKTMHGLLSGAKKGIGVSGALVSIGEKFEGRPHCGRDDAFNIAKIIRYILQENRLKIRWWNL